MMTVHSTRNGVPPEGYTATGAPEPLPAGEPIPVSEPEVQPEPNEPGTEEDIPEAQQPPPDEPEAPEPAPAAKPRNHHRRH